MPAGDFEMERFEEVRNWRWENNPEAVQKMEEIMKGYHVLVHTGRREIYVIER